ncbi:GIY-YIG nuclease family protein [Olleya sp. 1-3]|uniref:GIY-YIG nuclease family protein n=1 Tax=Olleya sp. 1-3 TaxID=2058323 RepID=UPI000C322386|nr:GIY-YIG nuclease family protein [Olleya sp. 1-3]PKG52846.1 excinuclease ABC subunit C [Olleya sp. 1-3]
MKVNNRQYYVYILSSKKNGTLYIGVTNNLERRLIEHKQKLASVFTSKYDVNRLMYFEIIADINEAIKREKQLKNWNRQWKIELIEKENPNWKDLSINWN